MLRSFARTLVGVIEVLCLASFLVLLVLMLIAVFATNMEDYQRKVKLEKMQIRYYEAMNQRLGEE